VSETIYSIDRSLEERKIDLIFKLYVDPADQDYLSARWAFSNGLFQSFYNSAGQSLEKYLKAALLLQDQSARNYGHALDRLYAAVSRLDPHGYLPAQLDLPKTTAMGRNTWQDKPPSMFADYLKKYGSPDNRFAFYGTFVNGPILHVLDILCHALRRLMRHTNFVAGDIFDTCGFSACPEGRIAKPEDWMLRSDLLLERLFIGRYSAGQDKLLRKTFCNMNMVFSMARNPDERSFGGQHIHGSPLYNALIRAREIDTSSENRAIVDDLRLWVGDKIQISREVKKQLGFSE